MFCLLRIFHVYSTSNDSRLTSWSCLSLQLHVEKDRSFQRYLANKEAIITTINYHPIDSLIVSFIRYPTSSFCPPPLPHVARFFLISFFFSFLSLVCSSSRIPTTKARFEHLTESSTVESGAFDEDEEQARPPPTSRRFLFVSHRCRSMTSLMIDFLVHHRSLQLLVTSVQRRRRSKCVAGRALVRLGYGGSGSEVGDSCYASRNISAVGFGSRLLFFASTTRNSISLRSRLANDSAISLATS